MKTILCLTLLCFLAACGGGEEEKPNDPTTYNIVIKCAPDQANCK